MTMLNCGAILAVTCAFLLAACGENSAKTNALETPVISDLAFDYKTESASSFKFTNRSRAALSVYGAIDPTGAIQVLPESHRIECIDTRSNRWKEVPPIAGSWERRDQIDILPATTRVVKLEFSKNPTFPAGKCRATLVFSDGQTITSDVY